MLYVLSACGSKSSAVSSASTSITPSLKLAIGTLRLENTDQAVDAKLASQLLPLWQLIAELDASSSAAPQETAAVVEQIQATMTADQISAINQMQLTQGDIAKATWGGGSPGTAGSTAASSGTQGASAAASALLGGGMPPDGGVPGGPMPAGSSQQSTGASKTSNSSSPPSLVQQVIQLLESKT